jgi:glycosyltransferase involved in cell wall biosynthesis
MAESTYPYLRGGVSAVMHDIVCSHPEVTFGIVHITWDASGSTNHSYEVPDNVKWIAPLYLSMQEHRHDFMSMKASHLRMRAGRRRQLALEVASALGAVCADDCGPFWALYDDYLNPRTARASLWPLLTTRELMRLVERVCPPGTSLADLFWLLRDLTSQSFAIASADYPRADVYHAHTSGYAALAGAVAARQNGGRFLLTEHNLYVRDTINERIGRSMALPVARSDWLTAEVSVQERAWMAWLIEMTTIAYDAVDELTYLYPEALDEAALLGAPVARARVVPNGINLDAFDLARRRQDERDQLRRQPDHVWVLAYVARIVQVKGLHDLLEALSMVVQSGWRSFGLRVMGHADETPEYLDACRHQVAQLGIGDHVSFVGPQNLKEAFGDVDLIVLPSHNEGQPLAILEAMTAGLPTVGTRVGGMEQLLRDPLPRDGREVGPCGLIVQPHAHREMADAILDVVHDTNLYRTFRANAFERVRHAFQLPQAMRCYGELYEQLVPALPFGGRARAPGGLGSAGPGSAGPGGAVLAETGG